MRFFDVTPLGKITSRFSKDIDERKLIFRFSWQKVNQPYLTFFIFLVDARLPFFVEFVSQAVIFVIASLVVVCVVYPSFTFAMILILGKIDISSN
jgi:ABC-type multidrug transport system fused ATPase/permease subunit